MIIDQQYSIPLIIAGEREIARPLGSPQAARQSICRGNFSRIGTGSKASCMAAGGEPRPSSSPPESAEGPGARTDRREEGEGSPSYKTGSEAAIFYAGLPVWSGPPLPAPRPAPSATKTRHFRSGFNGVLQESQHKACLASKDCLWSASSQVSRCERRILI